MKISIITYGLTGWGGGIDLIRKFASSLGSKSIGQKNYLISPSRDFEHHTRNILYPLREITRQIFDRRPIKWVKRPSIFSKVLSGLMDEFQSDLNIIYGGSSFSAQVKTAIEHKADVIFPCVYVPLKYKNKIPWIGYIIDFQHFYYPHFFSEGELKQRDKICAGMLRDASHIVTNSQDTINDIKKLYPETLAKLHSLPFCPFPEKEWLNAKLDVREKYNISFEYFIISNQFWTHKDHETAFRAYEIYQGSGGKAKLVCTGSTTDFRSPQHFHRLKQLLLDLGIADSVYILGHIPKIDQIALLKNSLGLIQPTLFEGGPGGGSSYDAISIGVPVIASNISINLEMNFGRVDFFNSADFIDLSKKMQSLELSGYISMTPEELWDIGNENKKRCGQFLFKVAQECIHDFKKK